MVGCSPPTFRTNQAIISKIKNLLPCLMTLFKISLVINWKNPLTKMGLHGICT